MALQVARFLSTALVHSSEAAPRRHVDAAAAGAAAADYGLLRGLFSPVELLRRPQLHRYAAYLEAQGAQLPLGAPAPAGGGVGAAMEVAAESPAQSVTAVEGHSKAEGPAEAQAEAQAEAGAGVEEAAEAAEAAEAEEAEEAEEAATLSRLQGEVALEGAACELLQRALAVAARHSHAALAACAIEMGAAVRSL